MPSREYKIQRGGLLSYRVIFLDGATENYSVVQAHCHGINKIVDREWLTVWGAREWIRSQTKKPTVWVDL